MATAVASWPSPATTPTVTFNEIGSPTSTESVAGSPTVDELNELDDETVASPYDGRSPAVRPASASPVTVTMSAMNHSPKFNVVSSTRPTTNGVSGGLPPMIRRVVHRSRLSSRPASASQLASTRELKLASTQKEVAEQQKALVELDREVAARRVHSSQSQLSAASNSRANSTTPQPQLIGAASRPLSAGVRDLGPLYSEFQLAAQQANADLINGFPGLIKTAFERTSYWKRAPPTQSNQLGTIAWIFLHYALPRVDLVPTITTVQELESDDLRLSWRQWNFLCEDWEIVPQLTSKNRIACLYQRYGVKQSSRANQMEDVGMTYISFVKCLATISLDVKITPKSVHLAIDPMLQSHKAPAIKAAREAIYQNMNAQERCHSFIQHLRWNNLEWVASRLEGLVQGAWYRKRAELTDAKSVYVHKPTCMFREEKDVLDTASNHSHTVKHVQLRTSPCKHSHPPNWMALEKQIVAGVKDKPSVLHLNPHGHITRHPIDRTPKKPTLKDSHSSQSSLWDEKSPIASPQASQTDLLKSPSLGTISKVRPKTAGAVLTGTGPPKMTHDESIAFNILRIHERVPLEDTWCSFPGSYIDMGVIEVLPPLADEPKQTRPSDPSDIQPSKLRSHKYYIELKNKAAASLRLKITTEGCEWLNLEYKPRGTYLALGMSQRLSIQAPTRMPAGSTPTAGAIGAGVEKMGYVIITAENQWTYEVSELAIPVYARLVLKGTSNQLSSEVEFVPLTSPTNQQQQAIMTAIHHSRPTSTISIPITQAQNDTNNNTNWQLEDDGSESENEQEHEQEIERNRPEEEKSA